MDTANSPKEGSMFVPKHTTYGTIMELHEQYVANFEETILKYAGASIRSMQDNQVIIADFCTAVGQIVLPVMEKIINLIKETKEESEILVVFEDKEDNNYNALFQSVLQAKPLLASVIFVMACATTMYKQCLPSNSTQFIFCLHSIHYLSKRPCMIKHGMLTTSCCPEEKQLYREQAAEDWKLFLQHRSKELKKGGVLFIITSYEKYPDCGQLDVVLRSLWKDKLISEKEYVNISLLSYIRTGKELRQPFEKISEEVKDLEIVSMDVSELALLKVGSGIIGRQKATTITEMTRTWSYYAIVNHLDADRTDKEIQLIVDEFYRRFLEMIEIMTDGLEKATPLSGGPVGCHRPSNQELPLSYIRTEKEFQQPFAELSEEGKDLEIVSMDVFKHVILDLELLADKRQQRLRK